MAKRKRRQEKTMEAPQQNNDDILATLAADAASSEVSAASDAEIEQAQNEADTSAREAAALEERLAAERIAQMRQASEQAANEMVSSQAASEQDNVLASVAARGREQLLARMRQHEELTRNKPAYVPPPLTDRQREKLEEEMAAGRRASERHAAQLAARPARKPDPVKEGFTTPVYRPGMAVPDPVKADPPQSGAAVANSKGTFSPNV